MCQGDGSFDNVVKRTVPLTTYHSLPHIRFGFAFQRADKGSGRKIIDPAVRFRSNVSAANGRISVVFKTIFVPEGIVNRPLIPAVWRPAVVCAAHTSCGNGSRGNRAEKIQSKVG